LKRAISESVIQDGLEEKVIFSIAKNLAFRYCSGIRQAGLVALLALSASVAFAEDWGLLREYASSGRLAGRPSPDGFGGRLHLRRSIRSSIDCSKRTSSQMELSPEVPELRQSLDDFGNVAARIFFPSTRVNAIIKKLVTN
jgi:hypothetical protein